MCVELYRETAILNAERRIAAMRDSDFIRWLEETYRIPAGGRMKREARQSRVSNCRRVEEFLGDLDQHWRSDRLAHVIDVLTFSRADSAPKHDIPIDGDPYTGTATLRAATRLYAQFCEHTTRSRASSRD